MVQEIDASDARAAIAREVLEALPDWFGIPESREASIRDSRAQPFWADLEDGAVRGVLALRETSPYTAELAAMGVLPASDGLYSPRSTSTPERSDTPFSR